MLFDHISESDILRAFVQYDEEYPDTNDYEHWLDNKRYTKALMHNGKFYPPKIIMLMADKGRTVRNTKDFSTGQAINRFKKNHNFIIIHK